MDIEGKRVLLYIRVSSDEQVRHGESLLDQAQALHAYCEAHRCTIVGEYHDEGYSARKSYKTRPALRQLLEDVERGEGEMVLFTKLDRWFRSLKDYYKVAEILERHGVFWAAILEDYETVTSAGRFKVNLMLSIAEHEADQTSERIKFTIAQKRARGELISGSVPRGYKIEGGKPVKDPETAAGMAAFWETYIDTGRVSAAMEAAELHGVAFRSYRTARVVLKNVDKYTGVVQGIKCEPYISAKDSARIKAELDTRSHSPRRTNRVYLFHGLVRCGVCGGVFGAHQQARARMDGTRTAYYLCSKAQTTRKRLCDNYYCVNEPRLERHLLEELEQKVSLAILEAESQAAQQKAAPDLSRIRAKLDRLTDAYLDGLIEKDDFRRRKEELEAALEVKPEPPRKTPDELRGMLPEGWRELYDTLDVHHKQAFWRRNVREITVLMGGEITFSICS